MRPRMNDTVVIEEVGDEVLAHVRGSTEVHALNSPAAAVLVACDGERPMVALCAEASRILGSELGEPEVRSALDQLAGVGLVEGVEARDNLSRRRMMHHLKVGAAAAVLIPVVTTVVAPGVAAAQSTPARESPSSTQAPTTTAAPASTSTSTVSTTSTTSTTSSTTTTTTTEFQTPR